VRKKTVTLRNYLDQLEEKDRLIHITEPVSKNLEAAGLLKHLEPTTTIFEQIEESGFRVVGNLFCTKASIADYLGIQVPEIIPTLANAIEYRSEPQVVNQAPCQEVVLTEPNLDQLPILKHCEGDGGNYISSGVVVSKHPKYGQNLDFHRCMQFSPKELAVRVVESRHFDTFLREMKELDVAVCVGTPANVLVAAATSVEIGVDELHLLR